MQQCGCTDDNAHKQIDAQHMQDTAALPFLASNGDTAFGVLGHVRVGRSELGFANFGFGVP